MHKRQLFMLIGDGNRIDSDVFSHKISHPRIALKLIKKNHTKNCIKYMMKKSAMFVDEKIKVKVF